MATFLCLHLANIQVSVCRTTGPLIYIKVGCFKRGTGINYKDVIMMGKLALRLCLISYYCYTKKNIINSEFDCRSVKMFRCKQKLRFQKF